MDSLELSNEQPPARMVAGALAHLATHMATGCQRAAFLAALLLERVANDPEADDHLRRHAQQLVDILGGEEHELALTGLPPQTRTPSTATRSLQRDHHA